MNRKTVGGAAFIIAGGFLGRETLVWAFNKVLDLASSGVRSGISFAGFSWQNGLAVGLIVAGLALAFWPKPKQRPVVKNDYSFLQRGAVQIIRRVRAHRSAKWFARDRLEPVADIARAGLAVLVTFENAGFFVPDFDNDYAEQVAVGLESYFSALVQMLIQGHGLEALAMSESASQCAVQAANSFNFQQWFYPDF